MTKHQVFPAQSSWQLLNWQLLRGRHFNHLVQRRLGMRTFTHYGASVLLHLFVGVGTACWFAAGDYEGGFVPGTGNGAGINTDSEIAGMPGGEAAPDKVVYFATPLRSIAARDLEVAETATYAQPEPLNAPALEVSRDQRVASVVEVARQEIANIPGPAPPESVEIPAVSSRATVVEEVPEISETSASAAARRLASAVVLAETKALLPPPDPGQGDGGTGRGKGRSIGDSLGGSGAGAGGRADGPPVKGFGNLPPVYPPDALVARVEGRVILRVKVDADGHVDSLEVAESANWPSLDQAALAAVKRWKFIPARRAGVAIPFEILVPVRFQILGGAQ